MSYYPKVFACTFYNSEDHINHCKRKPAMKLTRGTVIFLTSSLQIFDLFFMSRAVHIKIDQN